MSEQKQASKIKEYVNTPSYDSESPPPEKLYKPLIRSMPENSNSFRGPENKIANLEKNCQLQVSDTYDGDTNNVSLKSFELQVDKLVGENISILVLNICGLKSKLKGPDFFSFISKFDLVCLSETKLSKIDSVNIPGYVTHTLNRESCKKRSGGVALLVKSQYNSFVEVMKSDSQCVLWCRLRKDLLGFPLIVGSTYIPPENSNYSTINMFDDIENDVTCTVKKGHIPVCLCGDFNARCGNLNDLAVEDNCDSNFEHYTDSNVTLDIPPRTSKDLTTNSYGHRLIEMCQNLNITILNGRAGIDSDIGEFTSKEASVVDYILVSHSLFPKIRYFKVLTMDYLLSDVHRPLAMILEGKSSVTLHQNLNNTTVLKHFTCSQPPRPRWNSDIAQKFVTNIDLHRLSEINECIVNDLQKNGPWKTSVQTFVDDIGSVL